MKKTLLIFTLLFSLHSFGQNRHNPSNPVSNVYLLSCNDYVGVENAFVVPEGKFWTFPYVNTYNGTG